MCRHLSRLASLPIAVRLGIGFGLLATALIATHGFGTFDNDTPNVDHRYVRALAVATVAEASSSSTWEIVAGAADLARTAEALKRHFKVPI